nr:immunoglobulin light chain junction region [Macaca mulatta]MOW58003.1 immunoglobulin light chain junction region [Macaca mulatta]
DYYCYSYRSGTTFLF